MLKAVRDSLREAMLAIHGFLEVLATQNVLVVQKRQSHLSASECGRICIIERIFEKLNSLWNRNFLGHSTD